MSVSRFVVLGLLAVACKKEVPPEPAPKPPAVAPAQKPARAPVLEPVNFASGATAITAAEMPAVDLAADTLNKSDWKVIVLGLADSTGDADANKVLSQQRAEAVAAELRKRAPNVAADRIEVHAIGERLATGATQSERKVEFVFYRDKEGMTVRQIVMRSRVLESDFRAKREQGTP